MFIRFENTRADYIAYAAHVARHSKIYAAKKRQTARYWWFLAALFYVFSFVGLFFLSLPYGLQAALLAASIPSVFAAYTFTALVRGLTYLHTQRTSQADALRRFCTEKVLEATPEGLLCRMVQVENKIAWAALETIEADSQYTYLYTTAGGAWVIPNNRLQEGDLRAFLTAVGEHYHPDKQFALAPERS